MKPKEIMVDFSEKFQSMMNTDNEEIINKKQSIIILLGIGVLILSLIVTFIFLTLNGSSTRGEFKTKDTSVSDNSAIAVTMNENEHANDPMYQKYGELSSTVITLKFGDKSEKLDIKVLSGLVDIKKSVEGKFSYKLKEAKLSEFATGLANKYNTFNSSVEFLAHDGETRELMNNSFGWILDESYTAEKLGELILAKTTTAVNLTDRSNESDKWWMRIAGKYAPCSDYGNTYVEVSIDNQYMWVYKNGEIVLESNVVTGNPSIGNDTPKGEFRITNKAKNATLYGLEYSTQVAYWMAFADDIGFHDATWQEEFGGDVYEERGSHGCVNLPLDVAGDLYDIVYIDMPVFVY